MSDPRTLAALLALLALAVWALIHYTNRWLHR